MRHLSLSLPPSLVFSLSLRMIYLTASRRSAPVSGQFGQHKPCHNSEFLTRQQLPGCATVDHRRINTQDKPCQSCAWHSGSAQASWPLMIEPGGSGLTIWMPFFSNKCLPTFWFWMCLSCRTKPASYLENIQSVQQHWVMVDGLHKSISLNFFKFERNGKASSSP